MNCLFCRIAAGELPCHAILETEEALAFLDIAPIATGHTLVIPRRHFERITELDETVFAPLTRAVRDVARRLQAVLGADGLSLTQANGACAGQVVPHLHFHLIPRHERQPMNWTARSKTDPAELAALAEQLRFKT